MANMNNNDLVSDVTEMLERAEPPITEECCIYRVPYDIRRLNKDAYTPKVVSIGPFHHHNPRLQNMERHKLIYFKQFLERSETSLPTLISHVGENEPSVRRCYSEAIDLSREELVKVIIVDSGFIFELFWRSFYGDWTRSDAFLLKPWLISNIRLDLFLLENQLPFFILEELFNLAFASRAATNFPSFIELTFDYFAYYNKQNLDSDIGIRHFTDLLRTFHLYPSNRLPGRLNESSIHLHSARELVEAGVKLKIKKSQCLLDLKFSEGILEIPQFKVEDWTEILFRNLVALEQCHYPYESYFTDYVAILNFLINTDKDVDVLVQNGILFNWLGQSNSVANLFTGLWKNITEVNFSSEYFTLCNELNKFYRHPCHQLWATLRRDYGSTPWQTAASFAAFILLVLTLIQSVCSMIQVWGPNGPK